MAQGDFSSAALLQVNAFVEEVFEFDKSPLRREVATDIPQTAKLLKEDSDRNTRFDNLSWRGGKIPPSLRAHFLKTNVTTQACTDDCNFTGTQAESTSADYTLPLCREVTVQATSRVFETNMFTREQAMAIQVAQAVAELDRWWNMQSLLFLDTNAGAAKTKGDGAVTSLIPNWVWNATDRTFDIALANYGLKMTSQIMLARQLNKIARGYAIEDGYLWTLQQDALIDRANANGSGDAVRVGMLDLVNDIEGFSATGITKNMFHIAEGSLMFEGAWRYGERPEFVGGQINQTRYSIASPTIPNMRYDVIYVMKCGVGNDDTHVLKIKTQGGFGLAPQGSLFPQGGAVKDTGIIAFKHV